MLTLSRKPGQSIVITVGGQRVRVVMGKTRAGKTKLHVDAPREVPVMREEVEAVRT